METCNPLALTTAVNTLAVMLSSWLDDRELALMSTVLVQLGDTLSTIAVQRGNCTCSVDAK
jgi:dolichol kinase